MQWKGDEFIRLFSGLIVQILTYLYNNYVCVQSEVRQSIVSNLVCTVFVIKFEKQE